jgi:cbb3-type cytochrome c oxidase subunit II
VSEPTHGHAETRHRKLERKMTVFAVITTVTILIGGIAELIPLFAAQPDGDIIAEIPPLSPLELAGRDIYVREGCYNCHSQMVRPFRAETIRFGEWSRSYEYAWERPFQFGSRRIGPDLHRVGTRYNDAWHYEHLRDPRSTSPGSVMPSYEWLLRAPLDFDDISASVGAMRSLGVPYEEGLEEQLPALIEEQASHIVDDLGYAGIVARWDTEVIAMIAYLQSLGRWRPMYPDLEGVALGEALFDEMQCRRCHGEHGVGGVVNPNYISGTIPALNTLAERLLLRTPEDAQFAIQGLSEHSAFDPEAAPAPFESYPVFAAQVESIRQTIRHGRQASPLDPAGADPMDMPPWRNVLNDRRIDALIAYLISLYPWEQAGGAN